jgi:hypothetical protein
METLFLISALCFLAVLWAAIALARHIKRAAQREAIRDLHLPAQPAAPITEFRQHMEATADPITPRLRHFGLHQTAQEISANKSWDLPIKISSFSRRSSRPLDQPRTPARKPPQPARHGPMALLDPAYFSKDAGDLSDPYQPPRSRVNGSRNGSTKLY